MRNFIGVDLGGESVPDATTLLKFRHLLEEQNLTRAIFEEIGTQLKAKKLLMKEGTIVDAIIINAPSSTKSAEGKRDPQMHQTRKGNQWNFGMKAHIGADAESGLVHSLVATSARPSIPSMEKRRGFHADAGMGAPEGPGALPGGASLPHDQKPLRIREGSIPGTGKNLAQLHSLFALANLVIAGRMLRKAQMA